MREVKIWPYSSFGASDFGHVNAMPCTPRERPALPLCYVLTLTTPLAVHIVITVLKFNHVSFASVFQQLIG
jgi:hypothetical protein